jgi:predicted GH43/DUF377 family glycosyl hydrolase
MTRILFLLLSVSLFSDLWEGHERPPKITEELEVIDVDLIDLESYPQDFIVETKEIHIPGFPKAYNPSIVRWKDSILLSFRTRNEQGISTFQIGLVWLDRDFNPISAPQILNIPKRLPTSPHMYQDPRLIVVNDQLYMFFSNLIDKDPNEREIRRMFFTEILYDGNDFTVLPPTCLTNFEGESKQRWEKNWAPFDYMGHILFAYGIVPHRILCYRDDGSCCDTFCNTHSHIEWDWGALRGGTPPLLDQNQYIGFFHSCKNLTTRQSQGRNITHYFFGAYTFSPTPPFAITHISPHPIIAKDFYTGPVHNTWKPLRVVFPCGQILDDNYVYISYGRQDHECWIAKLDKKKLLDSLVPVR